MNYFFCRTAFRVLDCKLERSTVDVEQINSRFDLALHYYLCPLLRY